ncbi:MAG: Lrp/AsnC ligand binding domain-containing protein [Thermoplasmatales archaeon]|nr:Lrp/AsnC ligand binding domain-containing protein [Thermoplasmatales archaeon]
MQTGFVLIKVKPAMEEDVYYKLSNTSGVVELQPLFGKYDLIAKIETDEVNPVWDFVIEKIRSIPGILDTETLPVFLFRIHKK